MVVTEAAERPILRQLQVQGTVTSARSAQLSAATSGQVDSVMVDAGARVVAGDILLTLDAELAETDLFDHGDHFAQRYRRLDGYK